MRFLCWLIITIVFFVISVISLWVITFPIVLWSAYSDKIPQTPVWAEPFHFLEEVHELFDDLWPRTYTIHLGDDHDISKV